MFEEIFFPRTAERYRAAPLVEQRERYLVHLKETGARGPTLRKCANDQLSLVRILELKDGGRVGLSQIEAVTAIWSQPKGRRCDRSASSKAKSRFINHAVRWLHFLGWLDEADEARHRHGAEVETYEAWMRGDRGLSEADDPRLSRRRRSIFRLAARKRYSFGFGKDHPHRRRHHRQKGSGNLRPKNDARLSLSVFARSFVLPRRAAGPRRA